MAKKDSTTPEANASDINSKIPEVAFKARQKTGGRQKGTPNKTTALTKAVIAELLNDYYNSGLMASAFLQLDRATHAVQHAKDAGYIGRFRQYVNKNYH